HTCTLPLHHALPSSAVLAEPAMTNIGIVLPEPGFHDALRELTRAHGTWLVLDETHTLCAGPGGAVGTWDLDPDAVVVGKTIGGGDPDRGVRHDRGVHARRDRGGRARAGRRRRDRRDARRQRAVARRGARDARG